MAAWFSMGFFWWDVLVVFFCPQKKTHFFRVFGGGGWWFLVGWVVKRFQSPKPHIPKQRQRTNQRTEHCGEEDISLTLQVATSLESSLAARSPTSFPTVAGGNWMGLEHRHQGCGWARKFVDFFFEVLEISHRNLAHKTSRIFPTSKEKKSSGDYPTKKCKDLLRGNPLTTTHQPKNWGVFFPILAAFDPTVSSIKHLRRETPSLLHK